MSAMTPPAAASQLCANPRPASASNDAAEREQLGPLLQVCRTGEVDPVRRRRTAELVQLGGRQHGRRIDAALNRDEGPCDRGVELRPGIELDLSQRCLV